MRLCVSVSLDMTLIHKTSGKEIKIQREVKHEWDENSEEYQSLCASCQAEIPFKRSENKDKYDQEVVRLVSEEAKGTMQESVNKVVETFRACYLKGYLGVVEYGGYLLNPNDFSGVCVHPYEISLQKK